MKHLIELTKATLIIFLLVSVGYLFLADQGDTIKAVALVKSADSIMPDVTISAYVGWMCTMIQDSGGEIEIVGWTAMKSEEGFDVTFTALENRKEKKFVWKLSESGLLIPFNELAMGASRDQQVDVAGVF